MIRTFTLWRLRRAQSKLQAEIQWLRDQIWTDQNRLTALEGRERAVQAELWIAESPQSLLSGRPNAGVSSRG